MSPSHLIVMLFSAFVLSCVPVKAQTDSLFDDLQLITLENVTDLQEIARYGNGTLDTVAWQGNTIAAAGSLGVWVYDANALDQAPRLLPTEHQIGRVGIYGERPVALSADGRRVAALDDLELRVWDSVTGEEIAMFSSDGQFTNLALSPDGELVIGERFKRLNVWQDMALTVWQVDTGIEIAEIEYDYSFQDLIFHPNGEIVVLLKSDSVQFFDIQAETIHTDYVTEGNWYWGMNFSADGELIALAQETGISVWNLAAEEQIAHVDYPMEGIGQVFLSPHGLELALFDTREEGVWAWNYREETPPVRLTAFDLIHMVAFAPDNQRTAGIYFEHELIIASTEDGAVVNSRSDHSIAWDMVLFPDNQRLAFSNGSANITLLNLATGEDDTITTDGDLVTSIDIHGELFAYGTINFGADRWNWDDGDITLLNLATGESITEEERGSYWGIDFAPDGSTFVVANSQNGQVVEYTTALFGQADGRVVTELPDVGTAIYSTDAQLLFVSNGNWDTRLIDLETGSQIPMGWEYELIYGAAFSPDRVTMATIYVAPGSGNSTIFLHDVTSTDTKQYISYPARITTGLAFNPAGSLLGSIINGGLYLFDVKTQTEAFHYQLYPHDNLSGNLTFSSDGRFLVTATSDGLLRVWGVPAA